MDGSRNVVETSIDLSKDHRSTWEQLRKKMPSVKIWGKRYGQK